jgi:hypothetical protein
MTDKYTIWLWIFIIVLAAFTLVGAVDYDDAMMHEQIMGIGYWTVYTTLFIAFLAWALAMIISYSRTESHALPKKRRS